jgi:hypothetical protein
MKCHAMILCIVPLTLAFPQMGTVVSTRRYNNLELLCFTVSGLVCFNSRRFDGCGRVGISDRLHAEYW